MKDKLLFSVLFFVFFFFLFPKNVFALVINHNSVADFDKIPTQWLEAAKNLTLHYAHTSHGSQIISGILSLEAVNSRYSVAVRESTTVGLPSPETPPALRIYDGNPPETYIEPGDYWDTPGGLDRTRAVANTGSYNYSMWSWCGQQSSNDTTTVQRYLNNINQLETEFPNMRFIYMTGHTDGTDTANTPGTLKYNNKLVRDYAIANGKVLFDFADIESYNPDGTYYPTTTDACAWCTTWCSSHPSDCTSLTSSCAHSHPFNCKLKAKAFWYMMARLAGWDGNSSVTPTSSCVMRQNGDADCNGAVNILDFEIWRREFLGIDTTTKADFDSSGGVSILDFEIWRRGFLGQ